MTNFSKRIDVPEIIDGTDYSETEYAEWLEQLHWVNFITRGYHLSIKTLKRLLHDVSRNQEISILDLGCGGGNTLIEILKWNRQNKYRMHVIGVDNNACGLKIAAKKLQQEKLTAELILDDGLEYIKKQNVDIIFNSLFTHHLNDSQITTLLHNLACKTKIGFGINDLHRHWVPYFIMWAGTKLTKANRLLKYDGPISIARAFKKNEWQNYFLQAGIPLNKVEISWHWSFRYNIVYKNFI